MKFTQIIIIRMLITLFFLTGVISCIVGLIITSIETHWHLIYLAVIYGLLAYISGKDLFDSVRRKR